MIPIIRFMNENQKRFYDFFMARVREDRAELAHDLLLENFKRQDAGTFTPAYMQSVMPALMDCVKAEHLDELRQAAAHMRSTLSN